VPVVSFLTEITSGKVIAKGAFGEVAEAKWNGKAVAIKSLRKSNTTAAQMLDEAAIIRFVVVTSLHPRNEISEI
jgi:predicted Ser/Thr protein kinase